MLALPLGTIRQVLISRHIKSGGTPDTSYSLSGKLILSKSGWLILTVPNSLVRGAFDALDEQGVELPYKEGILNAHISVMNKKEIEKIGGPDKITERGHSFRYSLGLVKEVTPDNDDKLSKVWYIEIKSLELQNLRKSYGLTPKLNEHEFHITIGIRRRKVLHNNTISKFSSILSVAPTAKALIGLSTLQSITNKLKGKISDPEPEMDMTELDETSKLPTDASEASNLIRQYQRKKKMNNIVKMAEENTVDTIIGFYEAIQ